VAIFSSLGIGIARIAGACAPGTNPVSHAIGRKRIIVPGEIALFRQGSDPFFYIFSNSAIALSPRT